MKTPQLPESRVREILLKGGVTDTVAILGVRTYFRDSIGEVGKGDVNVYDDAMFLVFPGGMIAIQSNADPSKLGWNSALGKPYAQLLPGLWYFIRGPHKGKLPALRQATEEEADEHGIPNYGHFRVHRKGGGQDYIQSGYYAINIHKGGWATTSSWGCQTIPPATYDEFMLKVWEQTKKLKQDRIPYLLVEGPIT